MAVEVEQDEAGARFVARVDGADAGLLAYRVDGTTWDLRHTEVSPEHEGHGVGSALVRAALTAVREQGGSVVPSCPFVRSWLERHPDEQDLVRG
ncbi:hypothetical protein EV189_0119 [Motilibacter rhizosphaerae]|uniref:Uncharacterized protein n=1 Tax=Motilibacter rhizosphaerae TaxID=598652 RepID=A0A4V2F4Y0_9ACTN|nr:GNAT family N-acetyltransferase [Motilibacter rhizosphaerae]RZS90889.1 hypothetical protein EV189_0119 [Motilibacter rhizosphaerae]